MTETPKTPAKASVARKAPQDRRPKAVAVVEPESYEATAFGNEWNISKAVFNNAFFADDLNEMRNGNGIVVLSLLRKALGDQYKEAIELISDENGDLTVETAAAFFGELFESVEV